MPLNCKRTIDAIAEEGKTAKDVTITILKVEREDYPMAVCSSPTGNNDAALLNLFVFLRSIRIFSKGDYESTKGEVRITSGSHLVQQFDGALN